MKRLFDLVLLVVLGVLLALPLMITALAVRLSSPGPVIYWSERVGQRNKLFKMPKFRSMRIDTPVMATHLLLNPDQWLTPLARFCGAPA